MFFLNRVTACSRSKQGKTDMDDRDIVVPTALPVLTELGSISEAAELGRKIGASLQKTAEQILTTSDLCLRAYQRYGSGRLGVVLRAAKMKKSTFMKFVSIAHDSRLRRIQPLLPPSFTTIHQIAQLTNEQFDEAIKAEIIQTDVRRSEIEYLRKMAAVNKGRAITPAAEPAALLEMAPGGHYELIVPNDLGPDDCVRIRQLLQRLHTTLGVEIVAIKNARPQMGS
jgi:hypothetical protein